MGEQEGRRGGRGIGERSIRVMVRTCVFRGVGIEGEEEGDEQQRQEKESNSD